MGDLDDLANAAHSPRRTEQGSPGRRRNPQPQFPVTAVLVSIVVITGLIAVGIKYVDMQNSPPANVVSVTSDQMVREYQQNEIAADQRFRGQILQVEGRVDSVGRELLGTAYVTLAAKGLRQVQCLFESNQESQTARLRPGDKVVIQGKGKGLMMHVLLEKCEIISFGG